MLGEPSANVSTDSSVTASGSFTRARTTSTPVVTEPVLGVVSVVGVSGSVLVLDRGVVLASLILVANQNREARAGGAPFEHAAQNLRGVGFLPLGDQTTLAGLAAVEVDQQILDRKREPCGATIDDDYVARPV